MTPTLTRSAYTIITGALVMVLSLATPSSAALVSLDLVPNSNDGLITLDTASGLEWLDLSATLGVSYRDVYYGYGGFVTTYGFRIAPWEEAGGLIQDAGIVNTGGGWGTASAPGAKLLLDLMGGGVTYVDGRLWKRSFGFVADPGPYVGPDGQIYFFGQSIDMIQLRILENGVELGSHDCCFYGGNGNMGIPGVGTYLDRPVPEPSTLLLLGSGLAGLGGIVWRRHRRG